MMEWRYDPYDHFWVSEGHFPGHHGRTKRVAHHPGKVAIDREDNRVLIYLHFGKKQCTFEYNALARWMNLTVQEQLEPEQTGWPP